MASIRSFLDLSTAHLKPETREWLDQNEDPAVRDRQTDAEPLLPFMCGLTRYGYFINVGQPVLKDAIPAEHQYLFEVFQFAHDNGCGYILFDADAPVEDSLEVFDEE